MQTPIVFDTVAPGFLAERVPLELWLQIFQCANLTQKDITNIACVNKFLAWVAQPLLFTDFTVTQLRVKQDGKLVKCQHNSYRARMLCRLQFVKSGRIAPAVKSISILLGSKELHPELEALVEPDEIVDEVFHALSSFPNLKAFHAHEVHFTAPRIDQLLQLPYLEGLHLDTCSASGDVNMARFRLCQLTLHREMSGSKYGWWIPLLRSSSLVHLSYDAPSAAKDNAHDPKEDFLPAVAIGPVMKSLRILHLPGASPRFPCFVMALSKCPSVKELSIEASDGIILQSPLMNLQDPLPAGILPRLQAIKAPYSFVERCLRDRPIKHVTTSFTGLRSENTEISLSAIRLQRPQLEELGVTMGEVGISNVLSILFSFRRLRGLHVFMAAPSHQRSAKHVFDLLRAADYPPSLTSLYIHCGANTRATLNQRIGKQGVTSNDKKRLVRYIKRKCPQIVDIEILAFGMCVVWKDAYTKTVEWYKWSDRGVRIPLP